MQHEPQDPRTLDVLDDAECWYLLQWEPVGRIAFVDEHDAPAVLPVNFAVDGRTVVFRTEPALAERLAGRAVSFQVDRVNDLRRVGWSVLVRGHAQALADDALAELPIEPWAPGERPAVVRIVPTQITGRRLELVRAPLDVRGYL
jgi:nitroimidazol reductase NimA-like FMN-containing flavoprotein (pyridoxamine 5'-phosphate oxidase superfamily)